jgi:very-short-patch-repair endonuclease
MLSGSILTFGAMKSKFLYYHNAEPKIFKNAKVLRKKQTPAEALLWKILRNRAFGKLKFRRQHPLSYFIADFYCHELKLIIELDGGIHEIDYIRERDAKREAKLRELGLTVIRFTNEQVFTEPEVIVNSILVIAAR